MVLFYFACYTPRYVLLFASDWLNTYVHDRDIVAVLSHTCFAAVYLNSSVNPFLYALLNRELRDQHVQAINKRRNRSRTDACKLMYVYTIDALV